MNATEATELLDSLGIDYSTDQRDSVVTFTITDQTIEFVA